MTQSDHLPQPATEASRAVWARVMNREVRERWPQRRLVVVRASAYRLWVERVDPAGLQWEEVNDERR